MTTQCVSRKYSPEVLYFCPLCPTLIFSFVSFRKSHEPDKPGSSILARFVMSRRSSPTMEQFSNGCSIVDVATCRHFFLSILSFFSLSLYSRTVIDYGPELLTGNNRHGLGEGCHADAARKIRGCVLYLHQWQYPEVLSHAACC